MWRCDVTDYMCDTTHSYLCRDLFTDTHMQTRYDVAKRVHMCVMTHAYVWHDSVSCVLGFIHRFARDQVTLWQNSFTRATHSYASWGSFIYVTWPIHTCDMTHAYLTSLMHICAETHSYVCRDSFICVPWIIFIRLQQTTWQCDMNYPYVWHAP